MLYDYRFSVWPAENRDFPAALFELFRILQWRVEVTLTEADFRIFRRDLAAAGLLLHCIERVPHHESEIVP